CRLRIEPLEPRLVPATGTLLLQAFSDVNQNGAQDADEVGITGVAVNYTNPGGSGSVTTGADGTGSIEIEEGFYPYGVVAPAGYRAAGGSAMGTFSITAGQQTTVVLPLLAISSGGGSGTVGTDEPGTSSDCNPTTSPSDLLFWGFTVPSEDDPFRPVDPG